jgi:hypothetical protein
MYGLVLLASSHTKVILMQTLMMESFCLLWHL